MPLIVAQALAAWRLASLRDAQVLAETLETAQAFAAATDAAIHELVAAQEAAGAALSAGPRGPEAAALLEAVRRPHPALRGLVWYAGGAPVARSPADASLAWLPSGRRVTGRFTISSAARRGEAGPAFWLAVPVRGPRGRDGGVLYGQVVVAAFASRIRLPRADDGEPVLLDATGQVAFAPGSGDLPPEGRDWTGVAAAVSARRGEASVAAAVRLPGDATPSVAAFAPVGATGWVAGVGRPRADALAAGRAGIASTLVVSLAALVVGLAGATLLGRRLTRPLERLALTARTLGEGDAAAGASPELAEEYAQVARAVAHAAREGRRRAADRDLARRQFASLLAALPDPVTVSDADGRVVAANAAAETLLGVRADGEAVPLPALDLSGRPLPEDQAPTAQAAGTGKRTTAVVQVGAPGSERRVFAAEALPVTDDGGRLAAVVTVFRDLTDKREADRRIGDLAAELRARTELVEALFARLPAGLALVQGPETRLRAANGRFFQLAGTPEGPLAGRRLADLFAAPVAEQIAGWIARAREGGAAERGTDVRIEGARREATYWSYAVAPLREGGSPRDTVLLAITDTSDDVATRVRAQRTTEQVERKAAELDAVLQSLADGVVLLDDGGHVMAMNRAAEQLLGRAAEKGVSPRLEDFPRLAQLFEAAGGSIPPADWPSTRALAGEATGRREAFVLTEARQKRFLSLSATPLRSRRGRVIGAAASFRDITREKEVESFKLQFIARAAHELRTPLTTIKGNLLLALKGHFGTLTPPQQQALETATRSVDTMVTLIDDLLDITRMEGGRLRLAGEQVVLGAVIERAMPTVAMLASAKGVSLSVHSGVADVVGYWDAARVEQVFAHVLSNAVRFTPPGGRVDVRAYHEAHLVTVAVRDTGIGIPRDKLALVFQPFVTLHRQQPGAPRQRGTGLGLSIAQSIVEAHGGRMWAESEGTGHGTTVYLTLPLHHRRAERARVDLPARVFAGETSIEQSIVADLSAEGASILAPTPLVTAKIVTVEIQMPAGGDVKATGEVVRVEAVDGSARFKAGVRFRELPETARVAILEWVRLQRTRRPAG